MTDFETLADRLDLEAGDDDRDDFPARADCPFGHTD